MSIQPMAAALLAAALLVSAPAFAEPAGDLRVQSWDQRLGQPTFVFHTDALQDRPQALPLGLDRADLDAAARKHLADAAALYGLSVSDVEGAELRELHAPPGGPFIARYGRRVGGMEVFRSEITVVMNAAAELVAISGNLAPSRPSDVENARLFHLGAGQAIASAFVSLVGEHVDARALAEVRRQGDYAHFEIRESVTEHVFLTPPRAKPVLWPEREGLEPAYYVELHVADKVGSHAAYFAYVVGARDGAIYLEHDLTAADGHAYRVYADVYGMPVDGPQGRDASPHPTGNPDGYVPAYTPANLVTLRNYPFSRNDPWLPPGAMTTLGNNVEAYADLGGGDGFQPGFDLRPPQSDVASGAFDYVYDHAFSPAENDAQRHAAVVNLFYVTNFLHDWFYDAGFDEAAGNPQASNFGRGGLGGDSLEALAQFHSARNRADIATPADGARPRMRLFVFDGPTGGVDRAGALDTSLIAHEWGHLLSSRLIGDGTGLTNRQGRALGEGWSDFLALLLLVRPEDAARPENANWKGVYAAESYVSTSDQAYYFGNRRVPYTTDFTKNGLSLRHIATGIPLPNHPVAHGAAGAENAKIHNAGEVWATMLWECYASLLNAHPFQEAQDRMKQYLVASLKATPIEPTFLEARDALLAVAAASDPGDFSRFLAAFAKRGAGLGAAVPDRHSEDLVGVRESHQTGNVLEIVSVELDDSAVSCDFDGVLDAGEVGYLKVRVRNVGRGDLSGVTATLSLDASSPGLVAEFPAGDTLTFGVIARGATVLARIPVGISQAPAVGGELAELAVRIQFPVNLISGSSSTTFRAAVNYDEQANASNTETATTQFTSWTLEGTGGAWERHGGGDVPHWHVTNASHAMDASLASPTFRGGPDQIFVVKFSHRFSFERGDGTNDFRDGGVLELSIDGGPWSDLFDFDWYQGTTVNAGYVAYIAQDNPALGGRPGYVGMSRGFPNFSEVQVNFGPQLRERDVRFRFRLASDDRGGAYGWDIRSFEVLRAVDANRFPARVAEAFDGTGAQPVCGMRPVAIAGGPQVVDERDAAGNLQVITLDGSGSFDPDGSGPLTYQWQQIAGPQVTLAGADTVAPTFTADVSRDADLLFELVVSDGSETSFPALTQVRVLDVNRPPHVVVTTADGRTEFDEGEQVTLDASGSSDPDGEELRFQWQQTAGPSVELQDATSAMPSFVAPEVAEDTPLTFLVEVHDESGASATAEITVSVLQVDRSPTADAGEDQTVPARAEVVLQGIATDPDGDPIETWAWSQIDGPAVELEGADTQSPRFAAPHVTEQAKLRFSLVVTANGAASEPDEVEVVVVRANRAPVASPPDDLTVDERSVVRLEAQVSDPDGDAIVFEWTQVGGPAVTLSGADGAVATFVAPEVAVETILSFRLLVRDDLDAGEAVDVSVIVRDAPRAPVAHIAAVGEVALGEVVRLDASGSTDPDGQPLRYLWERIDGPEVVLEGVDSPIATFTVPALDEAATVRFRVVVTDPDGLTAADEVEVDLPATPAKKAPAKKKKKESGCSAGGADASSLGGLLGLLLLRRRRSHG